MLRPVAPAPLGACKKHAWQGRRITAGDSCSEDDDAARNVAAVFESYSASNSSACWRRPAGSVGCSVSRCREHGEGGWSEHQRSPLTRGRP